MEWSSISSTYVQSKQSVNGIINSQSKHVCTKWVIKYNLGKTLATYYLCQYLLIVDINYCYESMMKFLFFLAFVDQRKIEATKPCYFHSEASYKYDPHLEDGAFE